MIEFFVGVAIGYYCRPLVATAIQLVVEAWNRYVNKDKSNGSNTP